MCVRNISSYSLVSFTMKRVVLTILGVLTVHTLAQDYDWQPTLNYGSPIDIGKRRAHMDRPVESQIEERQIDKNPDEVIPVMNARSSSLAEPFLQTRRGLNWANVAQSVAHAVSQGIQAYHQFGNKGRASQADDVDEERLAHAKRIGIEVLIHALVDPQVVRYLHRSCIDGRGLPESSTRYVSSRGWTPPGKPPPYVPGLYF